MTNQECIDLLKTSAVAWNCWRRENKEVIPNLRSADLRGADLNEANLRGVNLHLADLTEASLNKAFLEGANLRGAKLVNTSLKGASLKEANLSIANLSRANLVRANLSRANLRRVNLTGADLSEADLTSGILEWADLTESTLVKTNLVETNLRSATLCNADFTEARLHRANLSSADLSGANLYKVSFSGNILFFTNLNATKNTDSCKHLGPSIIDHTTLLKSGTVSPTFLRGCGLPDLLIDYYPSLLNQPISFYSCFISYSHDDNVYARRLHDQLQGRGIRCWLDEHQLLPGDDIFEKVDQGIRHWDKVLLCASDSSLSSWWVENEIKKAFKKEQTLMRQRGKKVLSVIPLDLDGYLFKWENGLADEVRSRLAPDFSGWENDNAIFERSFEKLVLALKTDDAGRELPPSPKL